MELFDLYDDERNFTGETIERGSRFPKAVTILLYIYAFWAAMAKCLYNSVNRSKRVFPVNGIFRLEEALSPVKTADRRQAVSCTRSSE